MRKILLGLCAFLAIIACDNKKEAEQASAKPVIKVGVSLPLTGDIAYMGQALKGAVTVAVQQLKNNKNLKNEYKFIVISIVIYIIK